jgi:hypothetical protein
MTAGVITFDPRAQSFRVISAELDLCGDRLDSDQPRSVRRYSGYRVPDDACGDPLTAGFRSVEPILISIDVFLTARINRCAR